MLGLKRSMTSWTNQRFVRSDWQQWAGLRGERWHKGVKTMVALEEVGVDAA